MASVDGNNAVSDANISKDDDYFIGYEDLEVHRLMLKDEPRTQAYKDAIMQNTHLFRGKIVMDVGAGTGILSLFMAKAGARKVYSIEASNLARMIPLVADENGFSDQIQVFHTKVEDFTLPADEKVDVIVSEWMGFYLFHESMLLSVIFARDKFLSEDGIIFPSEARLYACPCSLENVYSEQFYFWDNVYGFNLSSIKDVVYKTKQTKPEVCELKSSDLLSDPVCFKTLNLRYVSDEEVENLSCTNFVGITKAGLNQGLAIWFVCDFDGRDYNEVEEVLGTLVQLPTSPHDPQTHWKQTVIIYGPLKSRPLPHTIETVSDPKVPKIFEDSEENENILFNDQNYVEEDEVFGWKLEFRRSSENKRHYNITLEMLDPETEEHPVPCVCPMPRCLIIAKMIEKEEQGDED